MDENGDKKMLRVKIEMIPFGIESLKREIFMGHITNDNTGDSEVGNYEYELEQVSGKLNGFNRGKGALSLLKAILNQHPEL